VSSSPAKGQRLRLVRRIAPRLQLPPTGLRRAGLRILAALVAGRAIPPPFFRALHAALDRHPSLPLGQLLDEAGEQAWGLTVLALALLTFIPGVANVLSLATILVGLQMLLGRPQPWLPAMLRRLVLRRGRIKSLLAKIEERIVWLAARRGKRRPPSRRFLGFLVAWTAFLAALPIPLPFANVLPAVALILYGTALLEEWPLLGWLGVLQSLGTTVYFAFSFDLAWKALQAMGRGVMG
jgi:hypothetical protein